jgi:hypothetical protein
MELSFLCVASRRITHSRSAAERSSHSRLPAWYAARTLHLYSLGLNKRRRIIGMGQMNCRAPIRLYREHLRTVLVPSGIGTPFAPDASQYAE